MVKQVGKPTRPAKGSRKKAKRSIAPGPSAEGQNFAKRVATDHRVTIWAYRQGIGDCFLLAFPISQPTAKRSHFFMMIDCGVVLGTPDAADKMTRVVRDIRNKLGTANFLDVLVVTHEHWDHLSGFLQAQKEFTGLNVGEVWLAWTEDPQDGLANKLAEEKNRALAALRLTASQVQLAGDGARAAELEDVLGFFGAAKGATTKDALKFVSGLDGAKVHYHTPGGAPITRPELGGARLYILGPPHDETLLKRTNPRRSNHEAYGLALDLFLDHVEPSLSATTATPPFHPMHAIPMEVAVEMDFFKTRYWNAGTTGDDWRRIDLSWLDGSTELALQLDSMTNNTSLVLAIEFENGDVLLFVADAQVGNWLSWQELKWETNRGAVTGRDLLQRTVFYKVGHHGSHNATLREQGLELMKNLQIAMIPVNHEIAVKKRWNRMPLEELLVALEAKIPGRVLRSDQRHNVNLPGHVTTGDLCFELLF